METQNTKTEKITWRKLEGAEEKEAGELIGNQLKYVKVSPGDFAMPASFAQIYDNILNFQVRADDVWILAYPRTGSNWTQEMVWLVANELNFEEAKKTELCFRSVLIEGTSFSGHLYGEWGTKPENNIQFLEDAKSPRHIKSHLPWSYLPAGLDTLKPKTVYVARNPKDACVSLYMFFKLTANSPIPFDVFCDMFMEGKVPYGNYLDHVLATWRMRHQSNILFLKYEDMKKDIAGSIRQTAEFLGKTISTVGVTQLSEHLSFHRMSSNPAVNREGTMEAILGPDYKTMVPCGFIRKGEVGDWKNHMNNEIAAKFDAWAEGKLRGSGLHFQ